MDNIISFKQKHPRIDKSAYINPYAIVIGDVTIHAGVSLWPGVIMRADEESIEIDANTVILDRSFVEAPRAKPVHIGGNVLISHGVILHGCTIHDGVLIGISANVLDGAEIGSEAVISAGALVPPNTKIPPRSKVMGVPGQVTGQVTDHELKEVQQKHREITEKAREYGKWFVTKQV